MYNDVPTKKHKKFVVSSSIEPQKVFKFLDVPKGHHNKFVEPYSKEQQTAGSTFHGALKVPIMMAQCFGLFPVVGFSGTDASKLRFTFCSGRYLYSMVTILGQTVIFLFHLMKIFTSGASFLENTSVVFYFMTAVIGLLFFRLATKWPKLCKYVAKTEAADPITDKNLARNCRIACILVLSLATVEHILSIVSGVTAAIVSEPYVSHYEAYLLRTYAFVWSIIPYNPIIGLMFKVVNIQCTFNWNFADAFVMCISMYLTTRLQQINNKIIAVRGKFAPSSFFRTLREDYSRIVCLIREIDNDVNAVIFVSYGINLFIICMQLLNALKPMHGYQQAIYFIYSFSFLLMRSIAVSLIASKVYTASRIPADYLYDVPSTAYCNEVQRFLNQVNSDEVALTGLQFFNVKRGLVLSISGTIITYELVLMQFSGVTMPLESTASPST